MRTYALYRGDEFLTVGSRRELAAYLGVDPKTITFYMSPTYTRRCKGENRLIVIRLEEDDNDLN
jgi:hypothetical protein